MRFLRFLAAAALFIVAVVLVLYGLYSVTFNEPGAPRGGTAEWFGHEVSAGLAGGVSLALGLAAVAAAILILWRGRMR